VSAREQPRARPSLLPHRRGGHAEIDVADLQGNLLRGYTHPVGAYVFVRVGDAARGRAWLRAVVDDVTTGEPWGAEAPEQTLNLAFTHGGLAALGVWPSLLATFPEDFRQGMAARADLLGDRGDSAPRHWEPGLGSGDAHVLVTLYGLDAAALERSRERLQETLEAAGDAVAVVHEQRSEVLPEGHDHFGFKDGIAQPAIEGSGAEPRPGDGLPNVGGGWRSLAAGEFVLGCRDQDGGFPIAPAPPFDRHSTFVVYRKMQMHPERLRAYLREIAGTRYDPGTLAAKMVGRWQDGTPLIGSPDGPDPAIAGDPGRVNDFRYSDDPHGTACPVGAHIRRANPRDHEGFFDGKLSDRHRIIRRGRAYGPPLPSGVTEDDGADRGLVFKCYQADIERQFEVIQARWIDDGDPFGVGNDRDPIIGYHQNGGGRMVIQARPPHPPVVLGRLPNFVTVRGGEYLVRPGLRALRWLAAPL
jgi:Dyp-type peroxidase family